MTLAEKMAALTATKDDRTRNMSETAIRAADAAFMRMTEELVPIFMDDENGTNLELMGGVKVASMFFAEMLQELVKHPKDEIDAMFNEEDG